MIYLDNAATSRFKPKCVLDALIFDVTHSANSGRAGHDEAIDKSIRIQKCREYLLSVFGASDEYSLIFTKNCTEALNLAIFGIVKGGERVLTGVNEHNSVLRPHRRQRCRKICNKCRYFGFWRSVQRQRRDLRYSKYCGLLQKQRQNPDFGRSAKRSSYSADFKKQRYKYACMPRTQGIARRTRYGIFDCAQGYKTISFALRRYGDVF